MLSLVLTWADMIVLKVLIGQCLLFTDLLLAIDVKCVSRLELGTVGAGEAPLTL